MALKQGLLIIISGPSGVGKGTLCAELKRRRKDVCVSISATTREPRSNETDGRDYFFVSTEKFEAMVKDDAFLEHAFVHIDQYGTPRDYVMNKLEQGQNVVLEIDVQGSIQARQSCPDAISIFILPPSREELRKRLRGRATESEEQIELRLRNAENEMRMVYDYEYCVVNDNISDAVDKIDAIITAESCRVSNSEDQILMILE